MATLSITIPDSIATRVNNAIATAYGYKETIDGQPNPQTKAQFSKAKVIELIKEIVRAQEAKAAANTAYDSAVTAANTEITLS